MQIVSFYPYEFFCEWGYELDLNEPVPLDLGLILEEKKV